MEQEGKRAFLNSGGPRDSYNSALVPDYPGDSPALPSAPMSGIHARSLPTLARSEVNCGRPAENNNDRYRGDKPHHRYGYNHVLARSQWRGLRRLGYNFPLSRNWQLPSMEL